jgi:hypothetical protein
VARRKRKPDRGPSAADLREIASGRGSARDKIESAMKARSKRHNKRRKRKRR